MTSLGLAAWALVALAISWFLRRVRRVIHEARRRDSE